MPPEILVINRAGDRARLDGFARAAGARDLGFRRVDAVDAHAVGFDPAPYSALIGSHFWGRDRIKPGALGCYLSHRLAWQQVAERGPALICEDDARLAAGLDRLSAAGDADLAFANDRMAAWAGSGDSLGLPEVVGRVAAAGGPKALTLKESPGADCYFLTPRGARRLLELSALHKIVCGVDWAMVWAGLGWPDATMRAAFPELEVLARHLPAVEPRLSACILVPPLARLAEHEPSVLRHSREVPLSALLQGAGRPPDRSPVAALLARRREGLLLDIGAGDGTVGLVAAPETPVLAFEPDPDRRAILQRRCVAAGASNVELRAEALGREDAEAYLIRRRDGVAHVRRRAGNLAKAVAVALVTGDTAVGDRRVGAVHIDTGGAEIEVLRGLKRVLGEMAPPLLIVCDPEDGARIEPWLARRGYAVAERFGADATGREAVLFVATAQLSAH